MDRKFLISFALISLFVLSFSVKTKALEIGKKHQTERTENTPNNLIQIFYNQKVNGYKVTVLWKPISLLYSHAIGPAILEFKNQKNKFTLTNNYFALPIEMVDVKTREDTIIGINKNKIYLDYYKPKIKNGILGDIEVPFLFIDLNFDGRKELMLTKFAQGQRSGNSYVAYSFNFGELESDLYQITNKEPYNEIDFTTELDKKNKKLIIYSSGGACSSSFYIYSLIKRKYKLTKIVRMRRGDGTDKCYKLTYSVKNRVEKLVSKIEDTP